MFQPAKLTFFVDVPSFKPPDHFLPEILEVDQFLFDDSFMWFP